MRNIFKLTAITFISSLLLAISCKKELDTKPQNFLAELKNFDDVKSALQGCYAGFQSTNYYDNPSASGSGSGWSALPDLMGEDMIEALESLGNWKAFSEMTYAADNLAIQGIFSQPYEIISRVNNILNSIVTYETGATATEAKIIKAQVLAIRAHAHFDLLRYFAPDYGRNSAEPGIPYITTFDPLKPFANLPARNTVKEVYDKIYEDLASALSAFAEGGDTPGNEARNFIDITVVYALRARVNYYASDWSAAITDASVALDARPLTDAAGYVETFAASGEGAPPSEVYWAIPSDGTLTPGGATNGSGPNYRVSTPMSNILKSQGGVYIDPGIVMFNQKGNGGFQRTLCSKYDGIRSFKVFRAGEMILIRAEAKQRTGDATALDDLNELRTNRDVATGNETGTALLDAILLQRRVELLSEGHRWFDIKKSTRTIDRAECGTAGASNSNICSISSTSKAWTFPIPFNDLKVNPNLVQNNGY
jgi:starch-binding outer membrane protein, SusD/RagB family